MFLNAVVFIYVKLAFIIVQQNQFTEKPEGFIEKITKSRVFLATFIVLINKMTSMKKSLVVILISLFISHLQAQTSDISLKFDDAIPVLNLGTFHMGYSPDANTTEFDEYDKNNIAQVHQIAKAIAEFKPTIIIVETPPSYNEELKKYYQEYLKNPDMEIEEPSELELLAFEVGRLANTQHIYGVDFQAGYNYQIAEYVEYSKDTDTYYRYMEMLEKLEKEFAANEKTVLEHLQMINDPRYLDVLININADMLTHVSSEGKSEGADEAAKFYHRNLVMYSNINQIPMHKDDRVFILMGGAHTAFFKMWMERSPKYKLVDVNTYLRP